MDKSESLLRQGLDELQLSASDFQIAQLLQFVGLIEKWNKAYNLTAIRQREDMIALHLLDSLAVLPFLKATRFIDIGTGAGLPSIPLAILELNKTFVLLDSNAKKTRFVQQVILELKLSHVSVVHSRVEDYQPAELFDCVLTRAFSDLSMMISLTQHLLNENGAWLAMKGQMPREELNEICDYQTTLFSLKVPQIDAKRCLVKITR